MADTDNIFYGDPFSTAAMTDTSMSIRFRANDDAVLKAVRTWLIFNDQDDAFTGMVGKIYSDRSSSPGALIATSTNSYTKAQILSTYDSGVKEISFLFNNLNLRSNLYYHLVINCSGYTYSDAKHIAWRKAWPDPVYRTGLAMTFEALGVAPYFFTAIGAPI